MPAPNLPSPSEIADKQIRNVSSSTEAYRRGVQRVSVAPGQLAAAKRDKYTQGVMDNVDKWAANVASVSLSSWAQVTADKGATRLAGGIQASRPKLEAFWTDFLPFLSSVQGQISNMPSDTFDQRLARMNANATALHQFRRRR